MTSHHANPWVMIDDGAAGEDHGAVYSAALAWSGNWQIIAQRMPSDCVSHGVGSGHGAAPRLLEPGEELSTPVSIGMYTEGGFGGASRAWHEYIRAHVLKHPHEVRPVLYNSWEATGFEVSLEAQPALADRAAAIGVELFVMDDGWFGRRVDDTAGLGDRAPNPERFPDGLSPLIEHVHGLGMKFGLWVEPEMASPDSDLYRAHPDWIIHHPHRHSTRIRGQRVLNLARPDVAARVHGTIERLLRDHAIDFLKWDMNRPLTEVGLLDERADDRLWSAYVENLCREPLRRPRSAARRPPRSAHRELLERRRTRRPGDARANRQVWPSDNTDAAGRLAIQHGNAQLYPAQTMGAWITASPNSWTGRESPLEYRFHVAAAGVLGVGVDLAACGEAELFRLGTLIARYKTVRPLIQHGTQRWLGRRFGRADPALPLRALDPRARYRDAESGRVHHGAVLLTRGLPLGLSVGEPASTLIHLRRL